MTPRRPTSDRFALAVFALLALCAPMPAWAATSDIPYKKIGWDDFDGPAPTAEGIDAETVCGTDPSWETDTPTQSGETWKCKLKNVKVKATMDGKQSGAKPGAARTDALLQHEQYHFDIAEYCAREMEKELKAVEGTGATAAAAQADAEAKANAIQAKWNKKENEMQEKYDEECDHSRDAEQQAAWCTKIGNLLNPPKPQDNKGASNTNNSNFSPGTQQVNFGAFFLTSFTHNGSPFTDPFLQNATLHLPPVKFSGYHMGWLHPMLMPVSAEAADFRLTTNGGGLDAITGRLRLMMGSFPDNEYTAWIEEVTIHPAALPASPFLQFVEASRAQGQSVIALQFSTPNPLSAITNQWTLPTNFPGSMTLGTTHCDPPMPPIVSGPESRTAGNGSDVAFAVLVPAAGPITYQWRRNLVPLLNGGPISGAHEDTLKIAGCTPGDAGSYDVVVTSPCGGATSDPATLNVVTGVPGAGALALLAAAALTGLAGIGRLRRRPDRRDG